MSEHAATALIKKISRNGSIGELTKTFKSEIVLRESLGKAPK
jgi:hypothetical protein